MEGIVHIRVDDRLIHGQVATRWATGLRVNRIMIIDDKVAVNDDEKSILRMAAPAGVNTSILTFEKGLNNVKNGNYKGQRVLLIVKTPEILVQLMNGGLALKEVNVGNMSSRPGTTQIKKSISMTENEKVAVQQLLSQDVKVTAQMVPEESDASIEGFLN
ncbi:PTS mannose/fructose/sorbose transporter subunit IIB [Bacillus cereus]|uniref:PTS mannose/fructose/sorbose transporter subunit IIB n=1 Tax=Bacillus cereus TaxID=1396 RepID=A0A2A8Y8N7_BACCE|nr:PTS sugar transporter subunit IIB [Bacillus cereus]PFC77232.1 PTS mannose/fructose/sorbose transporter subunit IIB [Bacillus cereus]PFD68347.1 PTS mannose/fructose/sorbose transporter subunit IIB [Bacillus cereus]PFP62134.1 PTS mannose/fructose/sorbose transporter subunit IIB [Bacillus cereus]PFV08621.1 PTS mannose/fructose/sorbose transporter subunit IIB [Bacillus cereus]PGK38350.1 PTS mannose/fructose/sorbose transporter subunit IIB [Bacillus cereus]